MEVGCWEWEVVSWFWLQAGEKAVSCGVANISELNELSFIKELHLGYGSVNRSALLLVLLFSGLLWNAFAWFYCFILSRTVDQLGLDKSIVVGKMLLVLPNAFRGLLCDPIIFGVMKHVKLTVSPKSYFLKKMPPCRVWRWKAGALYGYADPAIMLTLDLLC